MIIIMVVLYFFLTLLIWNWFWNFLAAVGESLGEARFFRLACQIIFFVLVWIPLFFLWVFFTGTIIVLA